jgi:hypothetical protein
MIESEFKGICGAITEGPMTDIALALLLSASTEPL